MDDELINNNDARRVKINEYFFSILLQLSRVFLLLIKVSIVVPSIIIIAVSYYYYMNIFLGTIAGLSMFIGNIIDVVLPFTKIKKYISYRSQQLEILYDKVKGATKHPLEYDHELIKLNIEKLCIIK